MIPAKKDLTAYVGVTFGPYIFVFNTTKSRTIGQITDVNVGGNWLTCVAHGLVDGDQVRFTTTGTLPAPLDTGVYYYARDTTGNPDTFRVALTSGGSAIDITNVGHGVHTLYQRGVPLDLTGWNVRAWVKHIEDCDDSIFIDLNPTILSGPDGRVQILIPNETTQTWKYGDHSYSILLKNTDNAWLGPYLIGKFLIRHASTDSSTPSTPP